MNKKSWATYWHSRNLTIFERIIQGYKENSGYKKLLDTVQEVGNKGKALEVGAGKAWISKLLKSRGWITYGIDKNIEIALFNSSAVNTYVIGDMYQLPFKEKTFDLVTSCGLIEHYPIGTVKRILCEMARVGNSVIAWYPTCGIVWRAVWAFRNMFGGNIVTESYHHKENHIVDLFSFLGFKDIKIGDVIFGGVLKYKYIYGVST